MTLTIPVENHTSRRVQLGKATKIRASSGGTGTFIPEKSGHVPILSFKGGITTNRPHYNCSGGNPQRVYKKGGATLAFPLHRYYVQLSDNPPNVYRKKNNHSARNATGKDIGSLLHISAESLHTVWIFFPVNIRP